MNIKDSYIHNGTAVLKDIKIENSVLKKILAGKDANDAYLDWTTVLDLTTIKPTNAGNADTLGSYAHTAFLKLTGGTMTGKIDVSYNTGNILDNTKGLNFGQIAHVGVNSADYGVYTTGGIYLRPNQTWGSSNNNGLVITSSAITYNGNSLLHAGNYTSYVYSKSTSDGRYVYKAGDTMTGALTVPSLTVTGASTFSQAINGSILGNATTASRLLNARTISLSGSVTGSGTFDGSGNLEITTTTNHSHSYVNTIGISGTTITWSINGIALTALQLPTYTNNITSHLYVGGSSATSNATSAVSDPYLCLVEGSTHDSHVQLKASTGISISANNGIVTITNTSTNSHTYTSTWTALTANANLPIAISPNAAPTTSGNGFKANFTYNPSTNTLNVPNIIASGSTSIDDATIGNLVVTGAASFALTINGNITSADKINHSLTIQLNSGTTEGTNKFTFNGSANKSINITPSAIGAKATQSAVSDPTASGTGISYIATISQNAQGVITATKSTVRSASTSLSGVVTTGELSFAGAKTFTEKTTISTNNFGNQFVLNRGNDGGSWGPSIIFQNNGSFGAALGCDINGVVYIGDNGSTNYKIYHAGNLSIGTLMGSTAIGDSDEPVYWSGSAFVKAGPYPTKASWNYDDVYLKLSGGTITNTTTETPLSIKGKGNYSTIRLITNNGHNRTFGVKGNNADLFVTNADGWTNEYVIYHQGNLTTSTAESDGTTASLVTTGDKYKWNTVWTWYDAAVDSDTTGAINKWKELEAFLASITQADTLAGLLANRVAKSGDTMTGALTTPGLTVTGAATFSLAINGSILGNAATASRLLNARTIKLTGNITSSSVSFDGSGNIEISTNNTGVRATTINGDYLRVNTNGTNADLTIPYAINAGKANELNRLFIKDSEAETAVGYYRIATITHNKWSSCSFTMLVSNSYSGTKFNTIFECRCSDDANTLNSFKFHIISGDNISNKLAYLETKDGNNIIKIELFILCSRYEHPSFYLITNTKYSVSDISINTTDIGNTPDKSSDFVMTGNAVYDIVAASLTSKSIGSSTQPVYFNENGIPVACTSYANASVNYATSAGSAGSVAWANVTSHPTKLSQFTDDLGSSPTHTHSQYVTLDTAQTITGKKTFAPSNLVQSLDDQLTLNSSYIVCAPQNYYAWHDHFAFLKAHSIQDVQSSTNGTSWVTSSVDVKPLFIEKEADSVTILGPSDLALRFTLYSNGMFHSCQIAWFSIGVSYTATYSATDVLVECSADKSTWTTLHSSNVNANQSTRLLKCDTWPANQKYVRFTFTKTTNTTTGSVLLNSIKGLTMRKGNQGLGRENEFPFSWDTTPNVTFPAGVSATSFTENGTALSSKYLGINANAVSATKATNDSDGNAINTTYLKKSGGTVTGTTTFQSDNFGEALTVKRNNTNSAAIQYSNSNGVIAYLGFTGGDEKALRWWDSNIVPHVIWHDGNDGSGSGLDADKLDGKEGSYYAAASSLSSYVTLSTAQTISGNKTFSSSVSIDSLTAGNLVVTGGASFAQTINGSISGSAGSVAWANVTDKPATATRWPTYAEVTSKPVRLDEYITSNDLSTSTYNGFGRIYTGSPFTYLHSSNVDCMTINTAYSTQWAGLLATDYRTNTIAYRAKNNGTWTDWAVMVSDKNYFEIGVVTKAAKYYSLYSADWLDSGITFPTEAGSYVLTLIAGDLTATGIFSVGTSDAIKDEIALHLHGPSTYRLYARTDGNKLYLASSDSILTPRNITIKYKRLI